MTDHMFPLDPPQGGWPGSYINVRRCGGMSMVPLHLGISFQFRVSISSRYGFKAVESDIKLIP